ncbi:MAG: hypothetical protein E6J65_18885 [Deltaproteobacteria bacterium]|nr:MAG: hypothetical protein E6J65_18885 [Deltaproteobacteria bacterium]
MKPYVICEMRTTTDGRIVDDGCHVVCRWTAPRGDNHLRHSRQPAAQRGTARRPIRSPCP